MINFYDPNFCGTHIVRVTFMQWNYVGHVAFAVGGNCKGAALLDADFLGNHNQDDIARYDENDCRISFDENEEIFTAAFRNKDGDILEVEGDAEEFRDMIVSVEIAALRDA